MKSQQVYKKNSQRKHRPWILFSIFFNMDFLANIVNETNRFGGESQVEAGKRNQLWTNPLTVAELKAWLGLLIRIGIKQLLQVSYYWSKERVYGVPASASVTNLKFQLNKKLELTSSTRWCLFKMFWKPVLNTSTVLTTSKQSCDNFA